MFRKTIAALILALTSSSFAHANNVIVEYANGDVIVKGDDNDNEIEIRCIGLYIHQFRGLNGTRINGATSTVILPVMDDLQIYMQGGDDVVRIPYVNVYRTSHADLILDLGTGSDEVDFDRGYVRRKVTIKHFGKFDDNRISVRYLTADTLYVATQGISDIAVTYSDCNWIYVESGVEGRDDITMIANDATYMNIYTSDLDDTLVFIGNRITNGYCLVELSWGSDIVQSSINETWFGLIRIDGGIGVDTKSTLSESVQFISFER